MNLLKEKKELFTLIILFIIIIYFWNTIFIYPIKVFVVLLHEMSHAIIALLLGGDIHKIQITRDLGGCVFYTIVPRKFSQILILSSGYLGSMFWGGLILVLSSKLSNKNNKYVSLAIGIITLILSFYIIKSGSIFGTIFCFSFSGFMFCSYKYLDDWFNNYMLKLFGMTSCLYVILDIKSDLIDRSGIGSDADKIAQITHIPSIIIGISWAFIAIWLFYYILNKSINNKQE